MKSKTWKGILAVTLGVVLTLSAGWNAGASGERRDYEIQGTWLVTVTQNDCSTGHLIAAFPSILTFAEDGTMVEDTANLAFDPGQRGDGQGFWRYKGNHTFVAKSIALIKRDTLNPKAPPAPVFWQGTQTITQTIEFSPGDSDKWSTSEVTVEFIRDSTHMPYAPSSVKACLSATAVRFE